MFSDVVDGFPVSVVSYTELCHIYVVSGINVTALRKGKVLNDFGNCYIRVLYTRVRECTGKPHLSATLVIRSPSYYGHCFWPPGKMAILFLVKKNPR